MCLLILPEDYSIITCCTLHAPESKHRSIDAHNKHWSHISSSNGKILEQDKRGEAGTSALLLDFELSFKKHIPLKRACCWTDAHLSSRHHPSGTSEMIQARTDTDSWVKAGIVGSHMPWAHTHTHPYSSITGEHKVNFCFVCGCFFWLVLDLSGCYVCLYQRQQSGNKGIMKVCC